jgi:hypothetical protein
MKGSAGATIPPHVGLAQGLAEAPTGGWPFRRSRADDATLTTVPLGRPLHHAQGLAAPGHRKHSRFKSAEAVPFHAGARKGG